LFLLFHFHVTVLYCTCTTLYFFHRRNKSLFRFPPCSRKMCGQKKYTHKPKIRLFPSFSLHHTFFPLLPFHTHFFPNTSTFYVFMMDGWTIDSLTKTKILTFTPTYPYIHIHTHIHIYLFIYLSGDVGDVGAHAIGVDNNKE